MNRNAMGLLALFRSKIPAAAESAEPSPAPAGRQLLRKAAFVSFSVGEDLQVVHARGGTPMLLPSFAVEFVRSCHEFRPLDEHIARYATEHGWHSLQVEALGQWLPGLLEIGALASAEEVRGYCAAGPAAAVEPPAIAAIGFPTGGPRVALVRRALESFAANLRAFDRHADLLVADSSAQPAHREALRALLTELSPRLGQRVLYSGEEERRRFAETLIVRSGVRRESVEFALFDPLGIGFACGANRNALLLHEAGRMLCSVDDDVVCRMARAPEPAAAQVALFSNCDPFARWLFPDRESALAAAEFVECDFLAGHEELLGREIGAFFPSDLASTEINVTDLRDDLLRRLQTEPAQVRTTFFGHVGDPGIPSSCYYLYYDRENLRRLTQSEAHYRAALASRSVLTLVPGRALGDSSVSPGMAMGLDHRDLLPPFFPVLHAEDFIHGATVWQCCRGAVAGHLPLAIEHTPDAGKPILQPSDLGGERRVVIFEFAHLLRQIILDFTPASQAPTSARLPALGRYLSDLAAQPLADFSEVLRRKILEHESEKIGYLEYQLKDGHAAPDFWRRDVEAFLLHTREALTHEDFDIPYDLKGARTPAQNRALMQVLFARYGQLLQDWPALVEVSRKLRDEEGISLAASL